MREIVRQRQVLSPLDLKRRLGISGCNSFHGEIAWIRCLRCGLWLDRRDIGRLCAGCIYADPARIRAGV
jgi:hypothetical protein